MSLDNIDPRIYLATLSAVAHADGLHPSEQALLAEQAAALGVDLDTLPDAPKDLADLPWPTRVVVYRDAVVMSYADDHLAQQEISHLKGLRERLGVSAESAEHIEQWVTDHASLLERFSEILERTN